MPPRRPGPQTRRDGACDEEELLSGFNARLTGHNSILHGDDLTRHRADLNNGTAAQGGVSQGPFFRRMNPHDEPGASSRSPIKKPKACRNVGKKGFAANGDPRKSSKKPPKLTRRTSGVPH
jgi:hypothetical protein